MSDKYHVRKPIEYLGTMYFPVDHFGIDKKSKSPRPCPLKSTPAGGPGQPIPVDVSGVIELPSEVALQLNLGQIAPMDDPETANREGYDTLGRALQQEQVKRGTEDRVEGPSGEKWVSGAPREVTPLSLEGTMKVGQ